MTAGQEREYRNTVNLLQDLMPDATQNIIFTADIYVSNLDQVESDIAGFRKDAKLEGYRKYHSELYNQQNDIEVEVAKKELGYTAAIDAVVEGQNKLTSAQNESGRRLKL